MRRSSKNASLGRSTRRTVTLVVAISGVWAAGCAGEKKAPAVPATTAPSAPAVPGTTAASEAAAAPASEAPEAEGPSALDLARAPNVVGPPVAFTAKGPEAKKLPDLSLSIVGEADTFDVAVIGSATGSRQFAARLNTCSESNAASFGKIEWTITCGGQKIVKKVDNACDPCVGESGSLSLKRRDAAACWKAGQTPEVAVKFAIDGVDYEATSHGPDLSTAGSTEAIAKKLEKAGVEGVGRFDETCCPIYPGAAERTGSLTLAGKAPVTFPYAVFLGTPERFPAGPVCQHSGMPEATLSYGFPSHRFDVVLVDGEYKPLTGAAKAKATASLDVAFKAAGGQRVKLGAP